MYNRIKIIKDFHSVLIKHFMLPIIASTILLSLSSAILANTTKTESISNITTTVKTFIKSQLATTTDAEIKIKIVRLDPRLTLTACAHPLEAYLPKGFTIRQRVTIGVRCEQPHKWSLYVPVIVNQLANVIVSKRALRKGHIITLNDIQYEIRELNRLHRGYYQQSQDVVDQVVKRNMRSGALLTQSYIRPPTVVQKGEIVNISASTPNIKIEMLGKALDEGQQGQLIRVRNLSSQKVIQAIVVKPGNVKIHL